MKKTVIYSDDDPRAGRPSDRDAERERVIERDRRAALRSDDYRPRRRRWPGLLAAGLLGAAIGAVAVSNLYDDRTIGQRVDATLQAAESGVQSGVASVQSGAGEVADQTAQATDRAATGLADPTITAAVQSALATDPDLSALRINVTTRDGVVTLEGPAPDEKARERAAVLAAAPDGVQSVDNRLIVEGGGVAAASTAASEPSGS